MHLNAGNKDKCLSLLHSSNSNSNSILLQCTNSLKKKYTKCKGCERCAEDAQKLCKIRSSTSAIASKIKLVIIFLLLLHLYLVEVIWITLHAALSEMLRLDLLNILPKIIVRKIAVLSDLTLAGL